MANFSHNKLWEIEFDRIVSKKDKEQDMNINQLKLEVHDTYKKDEKITTDFEASNPEDVVNNGVLDEKLMKIKGHLSLLEKDQNEVKLQHNKKSLENLIQRAVKTTIQILYDKSLFDSLPNANQGLKIVLFVTRLRFDLEEVNEILQ